MLILFWLITRGALYGTWYTGMPPPCWAGEGRSDAKKKVQPLSRVCSRSSERMLYLAMDSQIMP
eukprot:scaffold11248_cov145-Skeletonema_menzelii.AAC.4